MYDLKTFSKLINQVTNAQGLRSKKATVQLLGTAAQESAFGRYLCQLGGGPGAGAFQMENATAKDIWLSYLAFRPHRRAHLYNITGIKSYGNSRHAMICNLRYGIAMARIHYRRVPDPFPDADDIFGMAQYWKQHWNTYQGKGTVEQYIKNWHRYIGDQYEY